MWLFLGVFGKWSNVRRDEFERVLVFKEGEVNFGYGILKRFLKRSLRLVREVVNFIVCYLGSLVRRREYRVGVEGE